MKELRNNLEVFGLDPREIKLYTFMLSHKDLPAYKISEETSIPRTTVYKTLESLEKQGFVSKWTKNGVKHFSAESPERLNSLLKRKQEALNEVLPELLSMFQTQSIYPSAKLYLGKEGAKYAFEMILEKIKMEKIRELYVYSDNLLTEQLPQFFKNWRARKNKLGTFTYLIVPHGTELNENYRSDQFRETRIMSKDFPFNGSVDVCGSLVVFYSFYENDVYSIVIDSPIVAHMLTNFIKYIWSTLESPKILTTPQTTAQVTQ